MNYFRCGAAALRMIHAQLAATGGRLTRTVLEHMKAAVAVLRREASQRPATVARLIEQLRVLLRQGVRHA